MSDTKAAWSALASLRLSNEGLILSDPLSQKRYRVDPSRLARLVAAERDRSRPFEATEGSLSSAHWWDRGWGECLDYYLWTRGIAYHDRTDHGMERRGVALAAYGQPPARVSPVGERLPTPAAMPLPETAIGQLLVRRRTIRDYATRLVEADVLSSVLWHGLLPVRTQREEAAKDPEFGALRSFGVAFDMYVVAFNVGGVAPGVYAYDLERPAFTRVRWGQLRERMVEIVVGQRPPATASWTIVLVADFAQYLWRYRHERSLMNLYIEAGRIAQQLTIVAWAYGIGTFPTPAIRDSDCAELLGVPTPRCAPLYTLTMGPVGRTFSPPAADA